MLIKLCHRIIRYTEVIRDESKWNDLDFESLRSQLRIDFLDFEQQACNQKMPAIKILHAKYALIALWDELIMRSSWEHRHQWQAKPLQQEFFAEHLAGEGFFTRLSEFRQSPHKNIDLIELYYICLCLGFEGMYYLSGREKWSALLVNLKAELEELKGNVQKELLITSEVTQSIKNSWQFEWSLKKIFGQAFLMIFSLWSFYALKLYFLEPSL